MSTGRSREASRIDYIYVGAALVLAHWSGYLYSPAEAAVAWLRAG